MENVPPVLKDEEYQKWCDYLEKIGYSNYTKILSATDFGIPQTRKRCFMVSILGKEKYIFPKGFRLKTKISDLLEKEVDEKYLLSEKMLNYCLSTSQSGEFDRSKLFKRNLELIEKENVAPTLTTKNGTRPTDVFIPIKNNTKKGYLLAKEGDGVDISRRMQYHRGNVQKDMIQTLTTECGNNSGVVVKTKCIGGIGNKKSNNKKQYYLQDRKYEGNVAITLGTTSNPFYMNNLNIRKITPKEAFRLMGVKDQDSDKLTCSDTQKFKQAGNSIVTTVLMGIFGELFQVEYKAKIEELIEELKENK